MKGSEYQQLQRRIRMSKRGVPLAERIDRICERIIPVSTANGQATVREALIAEDLRRLFVAEGLRVQREVVIAGNRADLVATDESRCVLVEVKSETCGQLYPAIGQILYYGQLWVQTGEEPPILVLAAPALQRLWDPAILSLCARHQIRPLAFGLVALPPHYKATQQGVSLDGYPAFVGNLR